MEPRGWLMATSNEYMDYCAAACQSIRRNAGACRKLPIMAVVVDEVDPEWKWLFAELECEVRHWDEVCSTLCIDRSISNLNVKSSRRRAALVKAGAPLWSPFQQSCFVDVDILVLGELDALWTLQQPARLAMAIEARAPYANYVMDRSWLFRNWGINYESVLATGFPLYSSGVIVSDAGCDDLARRWVSQLLRLETLGWEHAVVPDDQLWFAIALAEDANSRPIELPANLHTLYLHHLRKEDRLSISNQSLLNGNGENVHLLHLVGMKRLLESGHHDLIVDYVRGVICSLLGNRAPKWAKDPSLK